MGDPERIGAYCLWARIFDGRTMWHILLPDGRVPVFFGGRAEALQAIAADIRARTTALAADQAALVAAMEMTHE